MIYDSVENNFKKQSWVHKDYWYSSEVKRFIVKVLTIQKDKQTNIWDSNEGTFVQILCVMSPFLAIFELNVLYSFVLNLNLF